MWQPIETAPKDRSIIMLLNARECEGSIIHASAVCAGYYSDLGMFEEIGRSGWINFWGSDPEANAWDEFRPTHWQPLPPPPQ